MIRFQYQQRVMPHAAMIVHTLAAGGAKRSQRADFGAFPGQSHNNEPVGVTERVKRLGAERVALDHFYVNRMRAGLAAEYADQRNAALGFDIDTGEIVEPVGRSLVDGEMPGADGFDDIPERCKGIPRQRGGK